MTNPTSGESRASGIDDEVSAWVEAWADRLTQFAFTYTGSWPAAEDVAQETFLRLYEHCRRGKPVHAGRLFRVAHNLAIDARRRANRGLPPKSAPALVGPGDERIVVRDLVDRLSPTDRQVVWLFYYADYSLDEIASVLGLSRSQVKNRLYHARERFRKVWRDSDG